MEQISEGKTIEKFKPSAYSLFGMYKQCGMIAAIDEFIYINQQKELEMIAPCWVSIQRKQRVKDAMR